MFRIMYDSKYGNTVEVENPKIESYKQMAYLRICGINSGLLIREDCYTVQSEQNGHKLADITFSPEGFLTPIE